LLCLHWLFHFWLVRSFALVVSFLAASLMFARASAFCCRLFLAFVGEKEFSASRFMLVVGGSEESGCNVLTAYKVID